ncbi:MAG: hypothetical protein R3C27_02960 [Hyphomonadaceae bacterium]
MSNSTRIWIGYLVFALTPLAIGAAALAGHAIEPYNATLAPITVLLLFGAWFGFLCAYQVWASCWRCGERLHRVSERFYGPIVLRRHCITCGVRHGSRPADVRANPLGHFGQGSRH